MTHTISTIIPKFYHEIPHKEPARGHHNKKKKYFLLKLVVIFQFTALKEKKLAK